jgi:hypothetical protein
MNMYASPQFEKAWFAYNSIYALIVRKVEQTKNQGPSVTSTGKRASHVVQQRRVPRANRAMRAEQRCTGDASCFQRVYKDVEALQDYDLFRNAASYTWNVWNVGLQLCGTKHLITAYT